MADNKIKIVRLYKLTHTGDPTPRHGIWGVQDCMGCMRKWSADAVIGVGGKTVTNKASDGIQRRLYWVGLNPHRIVLPGDIKNVNGRPYSPVVVFEHFLIYEKRGATINAHNYPKIYEREYLSKVSQGLCRFDLSDPNLDAGLRRELLGIIDLARCAAPSPICGLNADGSLAIPEDEIIEICRKTADRERCKGSCEGQCCDNDCNC